MNARAAIIAINRPRGVYVPAAEVEAHLACGWRLLDDCPDLDEVLLGPPEPALFELEAA